MVIAITGGIGSGKSTVAEMIRNAGYEVISTDEKAKELMMSNPEIRTRLIAEFGANSYLSDGNLNNKFLAEKVFGSSGENNKALNKLNSIIHPYVIEYMIEEVEKLERSGKSHIFVESALVYEAALDEGFDYIIVVDAPEEVVIERIMKRSGITREQVLMRINSQISPAEKRGLADFVIDNKGTMDDLKKSVDFLIGVIKLLKVC